MNKFLLILSFVFFFFSASSQHFGPDQSFGQKGIVTTPGIDAYSCVTEQSDGKVVAAVANSFTLVRLNPDGSLDNTFGVNGKATVSFPGVPWPYNVGNYPPAAPSLGNIYSIAINREGKIAAAGRVDYRGWFSGVGLVVAIFNTDGTPANGSNEVTPILNTKYTGDIFASNMRASSVAAQNDGKFVVIGEEQLVTGLGDVVGTNFLVARYGADGSMNGMVSTRVPLPIRVFHRALYAYSVAVQDNGQIVVVGEGGNPDDYDAPLGTILLRYNPDLTPDNSFGTGGIKYTSFPVIFSNVIAFPPDYLSDHSIAVQQDGKIVATGTDNSGLAVARFNANGSLDNTFGVNGIASIGLPTKTASIRIKDDGKILVTGAENFKFGMARLTTIGMLDNSFEGGGKINIPVDMKIVNTEITPHRVYAVGSSQGVGAIAAFSMNNACTSPTFRNDQTTVLDASCSGNDGNISLLPTSGTAPFKYSVDGGATYTSGPADGYTFQGLAAGTYHLRLKDANGCESDIVSREVQRYYGGPAFRNDQTIVLDASCSGNDGNISIIPTCGAAPFLYSINGGATYVEGPATGYTFQNLAAGSYQLRLKDASGRESAVVTREVRRFFGVPAFRNDLTVVLDATCSNPGLITMIPTSGTAPFQYSIDGGTTYVTGPATGYSFQGLIPGAYTLRLKDATGCQSDPVQRMVNLVGPCEIRVPFVKGKDQPGAEQTNTLTVMAYPNPSHGQFQVQLSGFGGQNVQVQILDSRGAVVEQRRVNAEQSTTMAINLSNRAKGLYLIRVVSEKGVQQTKVMIQ